MPNGMPLGMTSVTKRRYRSAATVGTPGGLAAAWAAWAFDKCFIGHTTAIAITVQITPAQPSLVNSDV